jgi:hypothetical protein
MTQAIGRAVVALGGLGCGAALWDGKSLSDAPQALLALITGTRSGGGLSDKVRTPPPLVSLFPVRHLSARIPLGSADDARPRQIY